MQSLSKFAVQETVQGPEAATSGTEQAGRAIKSAVGIKAVTRWVEKEKQSAAGDSRQKRQCQLEVPGPKRCLQSRWNCRRCGASFFALAIHHRWRSVQR